MNGVTPTAIAFEKSRFPKMFKPIIPPINRMVSPKIFASKIVKNELFLGVKIEVMKAQRGADKR